MTVGLTEKLYPLPACIGKRTPSIRASGEVQAPAASRKASAS